MVASGLSSPGSARTHWVKPDGSPVSDSGLPTEERFAFEVLRRATGATFTEYDDNSRPGMADGLFEVNGRPVGAVEVTIVGDPIAIESESLGGRGDWTVEGSRWAWMIHVAPDVRLGELRSHLSELVLSCESMGCTSLRALDPPPVTAAFRWAEESGISMTAAPRARQPRIYVLPGAIGGWPGDGLARMGDWLTGVLSQPRTSSKIAKLVATGRPDRHLFLVVHQSGIPTGLLSAMLDQPSPADVAAPACPDLAGLWICPRWGSGILRWLTGDGWGWFTELG